VDGAARKPFVPGTVVLLRAPQGTFEAKVEDGRLHLGDPVSAHVPDVPGGEHLTIADLLKMRSGLHNCTSAPRTGGDSGRRPGKGLDPTRGTGRRVPAPTGVPARRVLRLLQHQLRTAGSDSREGRRAPLGPAVPGPAVRPAGAAADLTPRRRGQLHAGPLLTRLHVRGIVLRAGRQAVSARAAGRRADRETPARRLHRRNPSYATAAGGVISTADDLSTWIRALVSGKVLNPTYQREWPPQPEDPKAPDGQANALLPTVLDEIHAALSLSPAPSSTATR
jgi:D-alanyl-D-alanine carboxypeptidase